MHNLVASVSGFPWQSSGGSHHPIRGEEAVGYSQGKPSSWELELWGHQARPPTSGRIGSAVLAVAHPGENLPPVLGTPVSTHTRTQHANELTTTGKSGLGLGRKFRDPGSAVVSD